MLKKIFLIFLFIISSSEARVLNSQYQDDVLVYLLTVFANREGVNPEHIIRIAVAESGLRVYAKNPSSSAKGLFQITRSLERSLKKSCNITGDIFDVEVNTQLGICLYKHNYKILKRKLKRDPTGIEMYYAHFFGVYKAYKFITIKNKGNPCQEFKRESLLNKNLFYSKNKCLSLDKIKDKFYTVWKKGDKYLVP